MQRIMALVHEIVEKGEANVPDSEIRLAFVKSEYLPDWYIPTVRNVDLPICYFREQGEYTKRL